MSDETDGDTDENSRKRWIGWPSLSTSGPKRCSSARLDDPRARTAAPGRSRGRWRRPRAGRCGSSSLPSVVFWTRASGWPRSASVGAQRCLIDRLVELRREGRAAAELDALRDAAGQHQRDHARNQDQEGEEVEPLALADEVNQGPHLPCAAIAGSPASTPVRPARLLDVVAEEPQVLHHVACR